MTDPVAYFNRITATYGLGAEELLDLFASQGHACAICGKPLTLFAEDLAEAPVVDHDHATGEPRGILCRGCNTAVGFIEKDRFRTRKALGYLVEHRKNIGTSQTWFKILNELDKQDRKYRETLDKAADQS